MSSWVDFVGYLAAFTVLATFCMNTIVPLRGLAIVSNILFIVYGIAGHLYPVFVLHAVLLPINVLKIVQLRHPACGSHDGQQNSFVQPGARLSACRLGESKIGGDDLSPR
jgi:hypothetical protein